MESGFIVWRWESTCSPDNTTFSKTVKSIMDVFWKDHHWKSVILVSNKEANTVVYLGRFLKVDEYDHISFIQNEQKAEPRRFLWYWIRTLYDSGRGGMRLYIDSDRRFLDRVRKDRIDFPVSAPHQFNIEKLLTRIRKHREMKNRQK